jgi:hypothetical protein
MSYNLFFQYTVFLKCLGAINQPNLKKLKWANALLLVTQTTFKRSSHEVLIQLHCNTSLHDTICTPHFTESYLINNSLIYDQRLSVESCVRRQIHNDLIIHSNGAK